MSPIPSTSHPSAEDRKPLWPKWEQQLSETLERIEKNIKELAQDDIKHQVSQSSSAPSQTTTSTSSSSTRSSRLWYEGPYERLDWEQKAAAANKKTELSAAGVEQHHAEKSLSQETLEQTNEDIHEYEDVLAKGLEVYKTKFENGTSRLIWLDGFQSGYQLGMTEGQQITALEVQNYGNNCFMLGLFTLTALLCVTRVLLFCIQRHQEARQRLQLLSLPIYLPREQSNVAVRYGSANARSRSLNHSPQSNTNPQQLAQPPVELEAIPAKTSSNRSGASTQPTLWTPQETSVAPTPAAENVLFSNEPVWPTVQGEPHSVIGKAARPAVDARETPKEDEEEAKALLNTQETQKPDGEETTAVRNAQGRDGSSSDSEWERVDAEEDEV